MPKWEGSRHKEKGFVFSAVSTTLSKTLRVLRRHLAPPPPFWSNNSSPLTVALSQQNAPFKRRKENFGKGNFFWGFRLR